MEQTISAQINSLQSPTVEVPVKYVLYARKSTESDERQIMSINSQILEMMRIAEREKLDIIDVRRESHSAKDSGQRPVFNEIIADMKLGRFNGILTWAPDRLSRNAGDLGSLVDLMDQKVLAEIRTYGQRFINSPNEKFLLMILCSQAKLENDNKSINVKRGLRMKVEMGLWPTVGPTGYLNQKTSDKKGQLLVDPERAPVIKQIFERVAHEKWSGRRIYQWLRFELNFRTRFDHYLSVGNIYTILQNPFYYGIFEYPKNSGNWYTGKHEPLIKKDLFEEVQKQLKRYAAKHESREFAFTKIMTCGLCGSAITACEKFKQLKDGGVNRHIYYGCTKYKDFNCKCGYINEEDLIKQLLGIIDEISLDKIGMREKIEQEITKYRRFRLGVLGIKEKEQFQEVDIKNYAKYILKDGTMAEKRELLANLKSKLLLRNKMVYLEK